MIFDGLLSTTSLLLAAVVFAAFHFFLPYFTTFAYLRKIPSPFPAAFTNLWLMYQCRCGRRFQAVHNAHKKFGTVVRIQPDHVSFASPEALSVIYAHGNGLLKSEYYDVFVSIQRGLFNTRDRVEHTRKRKIVSHTFSPKNVGAFEPYIHHNLEDLVDQWTSISSKEGKKNGFAEIDALNWFVKYRTRKFIFLTPHRYNYLAFDVIGDLAFGAPFGMVKSGRDIATVVKADGTTSYLPAVDILNRRGEVSGTLGCLPWLKPYAKYLPDSFYSKGLEAVANLAGMATARVNERLEKGDPGRVDLLARLQEGKDVNGQPMGKAELTAEALTQLIAGSDTTSNTSCALLFHVLNTKGVQENLQKELDQALPEGVVVPSYDDVRDLP
jgi:benzoate 4-monooxygenase